ncbi:MAG: hypothetical protein RDV48_29255 [Candidatus Eremiobacteraeota bacterium]|nr:hypothetical protein [Candidatus Eremiobacteraeota bacterium]
MRHTAKQRGIALATMLMIILVVIVLAVTVVGITTSQMRYSLKRNSEIVTRQAALSGMQEARYLVNSWYDWNTLDSLNMAPLPAGALILHEATPAEQYLEYEAPLAGTGAFFTVRIEKISDTECRVASSGYFKDPALHHQWEKDISASFRRDRLDPFYICGDGSNGGFLGIVDTDVGGDISSNIKGDYYIVKGKKTGDLETGKSFNVYRPESCKWEPGLPNWIYKLFGGKKVNCQPEKTKMSELAFEHYDESDESIKEIPNVSGKNVSPQTIPLTPGKWFTGEAELSNYTFLIKNSGSGGTPTYIFLTGGLQKWISTPSLSELTEDNGDPFWEAIVGNLETNLVALLGDFKFNAALTNCKVELEDPSKPSPVIIGGKDPDDFSVSLVNSSVNATIMARKVFAHDSEIRSSGVPVYTGARILSWQEQ